MKKILIIMGFCMLYSCKNQAQDSIEPQPLNTTPMTKETIYLYKVNDLSGNEFDFASLKGKKILIVNTASKCGFRKIMELLFQ